MPLQPGLLLLLWCGVAATTVARPIARHTPASADRRARVLALAADLLAFPLLYAVVFELIGQAHLVNGAVLGAVHGALAMSAGYARGTGLDRGAHIRTFLARTLYGAVFAFVYIVPPA